VPAHPEPTTTYVLVTTEDALSLDVVAVSVQAIPDLTTANSNNPRLTTTAKIPALNLSPDFPASKPSVEVLAASALLVLFLTVVLDLPPVSASSIPALDQALVLSLPFTLVVKMSLVLALVLRVSVVMVDLLPALIL